MGTLLSEMPSSPAPVREKGEIDERHTVGQVDY
jgi:hypothetical protein